MKTNKGFTLIELLVVVLIIGILAAIAVPQYQKSVGRSRVAKVLPLLRSVMQAQDAYYLANGVYSTNLDELDISVAHGDLLDTYIDNPNLNVYQDVLGGNLNLYKSHHGIVWKGPHTTIDFWEVDDIKCYTENMETDLGEQICSTFGPKIFTKPSGAGYYQMHM